MLTPLVTTYLSGLGDAGPGERLLAERHAAAMRIVLAARDDGVADQLARELPTPPEGFSYHELMSITALESWLCQPAEADDDPLPGI
ncbi:hypothetical protein GCM10010404_90960 [Nonomuraea africana]|uniref:Uncharacterized protein n=2 Tax=Nonomuraea africana TaxID=46171 RepID=A0ABR9KE06_9ACTN|nr:hypothetical protein [Nonomuraea africana]